MKKMLAILLTITISLSAAACGSTPKAVKEKVSHVYRTTEVAFPENITISSMIANGDAVTILGRETVSTEPRVTRQVLLTMDVSGTLSEPVELTATAEGATIYGIAPLPDGRILNVEQETIMVDETRTIHYRLVCEGEAAVDDLAAMFSPPPADMRGTFVVRDLAADDAGNLYVSCGYAVLVMDSEYRKLFEIPFEGSNAVHAIGSTSDGRVWVRYTDYAEDNNARLRFIDFEAKALGEDVPVPDTVQLDSAGYYLGPGFDIYINDGKSVWGYADGEAAELLNWINSDIIEDEIGDLAILNADTFAAYSMETIDNRNVYTMYLLERVPEEEIPEKYIVRVVLNEGARYRFEHTVVKFNRQSEEYRVVMDDYSRYYTEDNYNAPTERLKEEMTQGIVPDVLRTSNFSDYQDILDTGAFCDLKELMEQDESFDAGMFFDSVLSEFEENGRLYELVTRFKLGTLAVSPEYVDMDSWNASEFVDYASKLPEGTFIYQEMSPEMRLMLPLTCSLDTFIDFETGDCRFEGNAFREILRWAKEDAAGSYSDTLTADEIADYNADKTKPYREGRVIIKDATIGSLREYLTALFAFGFEDIHFIGYPTESGSGTFMGVEESYAVAKDSPVKAGAWEFVKFAAANQSATGLSMGFPSVKSLFDSEMEAAATQHWFFYFDGRIQGWSGNADLSRMFNMSDGILRDVTAEDLQNVKALIEGARAMPDPKGDIMTIILEEAAMYFSGDKSLEETAQVIQNRVGVYVAENHK